MDWIDCTIKMPKRLGAHLLILIGSKIFNSIVIYDESIYNLAFQKDYFYNEVIVFCSIKYGIDYFNGSDDYYEREEIVKSRWIVSDCFKMPSHWIYIPPHLKLKDFNSFI